MIKDLTCFIGLKAFIRNDKDLLILHNPLMGLDLPGGKIQENELDLKRALQREVREETNLSISVGAPFFTWFFTVPTDSGHRSAGKKIFSVGYQCTYISDKVKLSSEHDWYKWINKDNYREYLKNSSFAPALTAYFSLKQDSK